MSTPDTTARPTFTTTTCFLAACHDCGYPLNHDDGEAHFPTLALLRTTIEQCFGWTRVHDTEPTPATGHDAVPVSEERWRCDSCTAARECAASGHQALTIDAWFDPRTGIEYHPLQVCNRCDAWLTPRVQPVDPPADYPAATPAGRNLYWDKASLPEGTDLAEAVNVLIQEADAIGWLNRWDAYLTAHPGAIVPGGGYMLDLPAGIAAADRLIALAQQLRERLAAATVPVTTTYMAITNAPR